MSNESAVRRQTLLGLSGLVAAGAAGGCAFGPRVPRPTVRVIVIGGGWAGAAAARRLRLAGTDAVEVLLIEREPRFVSSPLSNLILSGVRQIEDLTFDYAGLRQRGVRVLHDQVTAIDPVRKRVSLRRITDLSFDALVMACGAEPETTGIDGLDEAVGSGGPADWKAGPGTVALRRRLEAMPDRGTFVLSIPAPPFSGPDAPYERVCQVAHALRRGKPRARIVVLDANPAGQAEASGFIDAWRELYRGQIDYRPETAVAAVHTASRSVLTEQGDTVRADVLSVVPPQRAGELAHRAGLVGGRSRWAQVDWLTMESRVVRDVYPIGDAAMGGPDLPKSAALAIQQGQLAAETILARLAGRAPPEPAMTDHRYSFIDDRRVLHTRAALRWQPSARRLERAEGAAAPAVSWVDAGQAYAWARDAWVELLG